MTVRKDYPRRIRVIDHQAIPMSDGTMLAARIWLPEDAEDDPVPAIIEYIPYRHRDFTLPRDELIHPWFAGHGYAAIRLDTRGSGNTQGAPMDEYVRQEQDDMLDALAWIAAQSWSTGACGMIGISWGGFSGLQTAFRKPPELKAVITLCSTDDRYVDDVHYMSGCLLRNNLAWGGQAQAYFARPPDPAIVGDKWREMWLKRLEELPFPTAEWVSHQRRDDYWKHGSVCQDWDAIECPVYAVTGWADGYTNTALKLMAGLKVPRRCLIGPWAHGYPHLGAPGPAIGFLQDCLRWWDRWLKGVENGIDKEPMVRLWLQDHAAPAAQQTERPGRWIAEEAWPSATISERTYGLDAGAGLVDGTGTGEAMVATDLTVGVLTGEWNPHGIGPELPLDQRPDDALSVLFDSAVLAEDLAIVGLPRVRLSLRSDKSVATITARLESVAPDGASALVTWGCLNLTHRDSHDVPEALLPGQTYDVILSMNAIAQTVPAGHRLRLALANGCWPLLWPAPEEARLTIDCSASALLLPLRSANAADADLPEFEGAEIPEPSGVTWLRQFGRQRRFVTDMESGHTEFSLGKDDGAYRIDDHGMEVDQLGVEKQSITKGDPLSSCGEVSWRITQSRGDWQVAVEATTTVTCDAANFFVETTVNASEGDDEFFSQNWKRSIPRDLL
ncbi:MAG: CocE/NonD family hydrolase [Rhodospirillaceae bacterium]|nr:CocE/NonD family hydrolase [Rhodospirillaceae bacterium]